MTSLVLAAATFVGIHLFVSGTRLRGIIVQRIGEGPFQGLFSLATLGAIVWMCRAYAQADEVPTWGSVDAFRSTALVLTLFAFVLAAVGLTTPSPTVTGGESNLDRDDAAQGILRITRHPFLWGVAIWAFTHIVLNGDAASLVLFGALLLVALLGPPSIDAKRKSRFGEKWERFAGITSNVPFAAIIQGRNTLNLGELGTWRILVGLALYALFLGIHTWLFDASPFPL